MSKVKLTISERVATLALLNDFKGNMETMAILLDDIKPISVTKEDWKKAERKKIPVGDTIQWEWNDAKGGEKEIELQSVTLKYLKDSIEAKDKANEITFQDKALISLSEKL